MTSRRVYGTEYPQFLTVTTVVEIQKGTKNCYQEINNNEYIFPM